MRKYRRGRKYYMYRRYTFIVILVLIFFIGAIYCFKYFNRNTDYVLKINKEYINKDEFLLYLNEQQRIFEEVGGVDIWETDFDGISAKDVAKNNTINSIVFLKSVVYNAEKLGIYLTQDEINYCRQEAKILQENINYINQDVQISLDICEKFIRESIIEEKVYNYITDSFIVDEKDFEKYFDNYIKNNSNEINKINLDYIFIQNNETFDANEKAQEIGKIISFEINFKTLEQLPFISVYENITLEKNMFEKSIEEKIYKLSEKSVSNIIEGRDGFYIFKINEILKQDIEEVKESVREDYISNKKEEIYSIQTKNWANDIKIKKNSEILSNL